MDDQPRRRKVPISAHVDIDLADRLVLAARRLGETQSRIIGEALAAHLDELDAHR